MGLKIDDSFIHVNIIVYMRGRYMISTGGGREGCLIGLCALHGLARNIIHAARNTIHVV